MTDHPGDLQIGWARGRPDASELTAFFLAHTTPNYISHGELLCGRATAPDRWSPRLAETLTTAFADLTDPETARRTAGSSAYEARSPEGRLHALAIVTFEPGDGPRRAWIDDFIVDGGLRGQGLGTRLMTSLLGSLAGLDHILLESGIRNPRAHRFFERFGFAPMSIVMAHRPDPG